MAKLYYKDGTSVFITHNVDIAAALRSGQVTLEDPTKVKVRKPIEVDQEQNIDSNKEVRRSVRRRSDPVVASFDLPKKQR